MQPALEVGSIVNTLEQVVYFSNQARLRHVAESRSGLPFRFRPATGPPARSPVTGGQPAQ
jgi:hypothetical protein